MTPLGISIAERIVHHQNGAKGIFINRIMAFVSYRHAGDVTMNFSECENATTIFGVRLMEFDSRGMHSSPLLSLLISSQRMESRTGVIVAHDAVMQYKLLYFYSLKIRSFRFSCLSFFMFSPHKWNWINKYPIKFIKTNYRLIVTNEPIAGNARTKEARNLIHSKCQIMK